MKSYGLVWLASAVVLGVCALFVRQPGYMDAYYYYHVAANLAGGRGLVESFVWNYLSLPAGIAHASNLYWMPLTSLVGAPLMALLGESFRAAQIPFVLLGATAPALAYYLGRDVFQDRRYALGMAALTLFSGYYFVYWAAIDSFGLFSLLANVALILTYKLARRVREAQERGGAGAELGIAGSEVGGVWSQSGPGPGGARLEPDPRAPGLASRHGESPLSRGERPQAEWGLLSRTVTARSAPDGRVSAAPLPQLATRDSEAQPRALDGAARRGAAGLALAFGAISGLGYLTRVDAPLLLVTFPLVLFLAVPRGRLACAARYTALAIVGWTLVVAPWLARNWIEVGAVVPEGSLKTLFLTEYNDFFSYARELSLRTYLEWGWGEILWSKAQALARNPLVLFGIEYYLLPFAAIGVWRLRRRLEYWPIVVYGVLLYLVMSLLFGVVSGRGSMLHSSVVLLPWLAGAAIYGLDACVAWIGGRLRHWKVPVAQRNLTALMVLFAVGMSVALFVGDVRGRDARFEHYNEIARWFADNVPDAPPIMLVDPPGYYYSSGRPSIVLPSDGGDAAVEAAHRYGARFLVLEKLHARSYRDLYEGKAPDLRLRPVARIGETQIYFIASFGGFRASLP